MGHLLPPSSPLPCGVVGAMRTLLLRLSNLLVIAGLGGSLLLLSQADGEPLPGLSQATTPSQEASARGGIDPGRESLDQTGFLPATSQVAAAPRSVPSSQISRVVIPRIALDAQVVAAKLIEREGALTWEVPAFKVGHAQSTAGAGEPGTAVLFGHVRSRQAGNVFRALSQVERGDIIRVFSARGQFEYRVVDRRSVPRTDVSILQPTATPSLSLVTCAGVWLPASRDYSERLVVHADLLSQPTEQHLG